VLFRRDAGAERQGRRWALAWRAGKRSPGAGVHAIHPGAHPAMARSGAFTVVGFAAVLVVALALWPPAHERWLTGGGAGASDARSVEDAVDEARGPPAERLLVPKSLSPAATPVDAPFLRS
jgi:hypothetical protein